MSGICSGAFENIVLDALLKGSSIKKLVADVHDCCGLPMIAFDVTFNLIAYAFDRPFYLSGWERLASQGNVSEEVVLSSNYLVLEEQLFNSPKSLVVNSGNSDRFKTAFGVIRSGDKCLGYFATILEEHSADDIIAVNDLMCRAVSSILSADELHLTPPQILNLLISDNYGAREHFQNFALEHAGPYRLVKLHSDSTEFAATNYISNRVNEQHRQLICSIEDSSNLWLFAWGVSGAVASSLSELLDHIIRKYNFTVGVSAPFDDLALIACAKMQAGSCLALSAYHPDEHLLLFEDLLPECFCLPAIEAGIDPAFQFGYISRLTGYGSDDDRALLNTLEVYLGNLQRGSMTGEKMGIHKNTVNYRLRRIKELLNVDIREPAVSERLMLELTMYKLYGSAGESHE